MVLLLLQAFPPRRVRVGTNASRLGRGQGGLVIHPQGRIDSFHVDVVCLPRVAGCVSTRSQAKPGARGVFTWQVIQGSPDQVGSRHQPGSSSGCGKWELAFQKVRQAAPSCHCPCSDQGAA